MMTIDEVAAELKISRNTVVKLIRLGKIKAIKVLDQYRIPEDQFKSYLTSSEVKHEKELS
jgi:excisionase family DNA binding protein